MANTGPEVPEADAIEQAQPVVEGDDDTSTALPRPNVSIEVPEADAIEQSLDVPLDDDWR